MSPGSSNPILQMSCIYAVGLSVALDVAEMIFYKMFIKLNRN